MPPVIFALAPIALLAYTGEALTGFGATLVAVTLGAHFYPIDHLVPVAVSLNVFVTGYIAVRHRSHIARDLLLRRVLPFMGLGLLSGLALYPLLRGVALKQLLGVMVVAVSVRELYLLLTRTPRAGKTLSVLGAWVWQFLAGVMHAFYATGGPLLVYSVSRLQLSKSAFRATLCTVWFTLNAFLIVAFSVNGRINPASLEVTAFLLPVLPIGILLGEWLHGRIQERHFRVFIYALLLASGVKLLV